MQDGNVEDVLGELKAVFEVCDQNGDGFVKTQDLLRLGQEHVSEGFEEMKTLIEKLDPEGFGQISFDRFCSGIHDFLGVNGDLNSNGVKEANKFSADEQYPRLTISANNDHFEDSCCEVLKILLFQSLWLPIPLVHGNMDMLQDAFLLVCSLSFFPFFICLFSFHFHSQNGHHMNLFKCHSENPSRQNSFEDLIIDRPMSDSEAGTSVFLITELKRLSSQVSLLQEDHVMQQGKQQKIRDENKLLSTRINALEEQLETQKLSTGKQVEEEGLKYKVALTKLERENEDSLIALNKKLQQAEEEIEKLKKVEPLLRKELDTCQEEKRRLLNQVDSLELALQLKADEVKELKAKLNAEIKGRLQDQQQHEQVGNLTPRGRQCGYFPDGHASSYPPGTSVFLWFKLYTYGHFYFKLFDVLLVLTLRENLGLKNSKEELNVQLHQDGYFGATQQGSLADELVTADKEKIINTLREQEEENRRLRGYLDGLLMMIMEHNPSLLELQ
ncbi:PREDICTED: rab11 family-interacting protein 4A-like [Acropora digitifera]|uniref:rab11 family-interacting protein 4A-like n=1 Tax=Acropora digitifera TaxID=70779 RepID=UPI00077AB72B|nr:PREDICTED: rab11 family-interacting protein 4A-like [Acropora digitifera]